MFFDLHTGGERVVLVHLDLIHGLQDSSLFECIDLIRSAGGELVDLVRGSRRSPTAKHFIGQGKLSEVVEKVCAKSAELVVFNHQLSPTQERNLERVLRCRVVSRTGLILDIFAQRARTHEGKLQVELAQLRHISTRLIRGWTHLERQKGGIGLRGPGETQLETDRRLIRARIKAIEGRLSKVKAQRTQSRRARARTEVSQISLVGYTNAGKSTLFNKWSNSGVYAASKLFATLDPTLARLDIDGLGPVVIADTVGFISGLPHTLVEAFRATLEETRNAQLLLHVVDASSEDREAQITSVNSVLAEIGAADIPQLLIFNKVDLTHGKARVEYDDCGNVSGVFVSAREGLGISMLEEVVSTCLGGSLIQTQCALKPSDAKFRSALYSIGAITNEAWQADGSSLVRVSLAKSEWDRLNSIYRGVATHSNEELRSYTH